MRVRWVLAALVCCAGLSGCTSPPAGPQPSPSTAPTASPTVAATSTVAPLRLGSAPLWTLTMREHYEKGLPREALGGVQHVHLVGDALLFLGHEPGRTDAQRVVVSDARTGTARWSATRDDRVGTDGAKLDFLLSAQVVGDPAGDWTLVTTFARPLGGDDVEQGIVGLSGRDGSVRWRIPIQRERSCSCPWTRMNVMYLGPTGPDTVLVEIATDTTKGPESVRTMAYDARTQRLIWTKRGFRPRAVAGGLLLAERPRLPAKVDTPPATLYALDLRTGAVRWDLAGRYPQSTMVSVDGDTVVVDPGGTAVLVDTATGRDVGTFPGRLGGCGRTQEIFVCLRADVTWPDGNAVTIERAGDRATVTELPGTAWCRSARAWGALFYCVDPYDKEGRSVGVDRAGAKAAEPLPGRLADFDAGLAVVSTGEPDRSKGTISVYAVS